MCGIVGYIGKKNALPIILDGLKRLEYRGYDSAGVAILSEHGLVVRRKKGKIRELTDHIQNESISGKIGIGHTRWATHGKPSDENAHPHKAGDIVVVHNGIIENYSELKLMLKSRGHHFKSDTDTEIIAHLIEDYIKSGLSFEQSVLSAVGILKGSFALGVLYSKRPDTLIAVREASPLVIGLGDRENMFASDIPAILPYTDRMLIMDDGNIAVLTDTDIRLMDFAGHELSAAPRNINMNPAMAEKGGYKHFMLKEIFEQPSAITDTLRNRINFDKKDVNLDEVSLPEKIIHSIKRINFVACGTSYHAGLVGKYIIEEMIGIPVDVDVASEFRYRTPLISSETLTIAISQSGETADTLAGIRLAKKHGSKVLSICNVIDSTIARESDHVIYTHAGPEISVASTKAFTSQIMAIYLFAIYIGKVLRHISHEQLTRYVDALISIPGFIDSILKSDDRIASVAKKYSKYSNFLYLGRGISFPVALEGALKLKEISYIHAEGYTAGEIKHGPIALISADMPAVFVAVRGRVYDKTKNNIEEVKARNGKILCITTTKDNELQGLSDDIIFVPDIDELFTPILSIVPLQLFAYHIAVINGTDVDQPKNLAKSVTVE
ncbi:MAG: glutamine--fructose-6-phosphate transaminase (isomerizing) [Deltaproteobacteria bacterium]|nr:glutamine--fructose-6-phosphate transaminase (isomerizing) [Deltaproteobacteria bacterium]MCL5791514.1 glutamine--fructose-6-phosphate transaminase (isomerizing) [Deltaproteobacteria bacterium]